MLALCKWELHGKQLPTNVSHMASLSPALMITQITPKLSCATRDGVMVSGEDLEPLLSGTQKKSHMLG